ncbi:MAG: hypothetical protein K0R12_419 [Gammaproteobacteria bacterium]|nr:hypothetical protein [Gammaproteobacteria bacterium]
MKKLFICLFSLTLLLVSGCSEDKQDQAVSSLKIGIIIPIEHPAMDEITKGFEDTLSTALKGQVEFEVMRAQGDINLQRAMILQLKNQNVALFVPVATSTTEMTAAMVKDRPIVGLAALVPEKTRKASPLALVNDEITPTQLIQFIHSVYPDKKSFALVYSNDDKIIPQVSEAVLAGKNSGITLDARMITTLPDLYSTASALPSTTEGIIVLKDLLVASGISTLVKEANAKHIPLITSDDGTVQNGASFALGVKEYQIGVEGAKVARKILEDKISPSAIPVVQMTHLSVFINKNALALQNQALDNIEKQTALYHYHLVDVTEKKIGSLQ